MILSLASGRAGAQPCGDPISFQYSGQLLPLSQVDLQRAPPVNVAELLRQDELHARSPFRHYRVGALLKTNFAPQAVGTWENLPAGGPGGQVWRLRVQSDGALWLMVGMGTFRLQRPAEFWVYNEARAVRACFTADSVRPHGQRWSFAVPGDTVVLEIYWPPELAGQTPNVHLGTLVHGYRDLFDFPDECLEDCSPDTSCPLGLGIDEIKRGVVRCYIPVEFPDCNLMGVAMCSGSLINNTGSACDQYVLTAGHCVSHPGLITGSSFLFNYERSGCCEGTAPTTDTLAGATWRAEWDGTGPINDDCVPPGSGSDFALLQLDDAIPGSYQARLNGWSRSDSTAGQAGCIHLPAGTKSRKVSWTDEFEVESDNFWRVPAWLFGNTKSGSSGGPLFNNAGRIIGVLTGGPVGECPGTGDIFGRLGPAWEGGGTSNSRLKDWLDPAQTNKLSHFGIEDPSPVNCALWPFPNWLTSNASGGGDSVPDPGDTVVLRVTLENRGQDPLSNLTGLLRTTSAGVTITDGEADWPDIPGGESRETNPPHFGLVLDPNVPCGARLALQLFVQGRGGDGAWQPERVLRAGKPHETQLPGFTSFTQESLVGSNAWQPGAGGWFIPDIADVSDTVLISEWVSSLPTDARLLFSHKYDTENNYGGGLLEYRMGSTAWRDAADLLVAGGYLSGMGGSVPAAARLRRAWSGDSDGWQTVAADLTSLAGQMVQFRWRFVTDASFADAGWWVDGVRIEYERYFCRTPGDLNCDGRVDFDDINPFVLALADPRGWMAAYPGCRMENGDINADGHVNFDDINPFVELLSRPQS
ncbi:MAG: trypsin-like peptidase domain-containing protein [Planctomycetota bacterium]